jgi:putative ABC transport system ATP-binding protein
MSGKAVIIEAKNLKKIYKRGAEAIAAINDLSLDIFRGDFLAIVGPSGSGKTTLLHLLGCLENPTSGLLKVDGKTIFEDGRGLTESDLTRIRRPLFGYIFQRFYLIPTLTVLENALVPQIFYRKPATRETTVELLNRLGLGNRLNHRPNELSGGEMQRLAIARALINQPQVLLADEPTGNLDSERSQEIGEILKSLNEETGLTIILVTHNLELAHRAKKLIKLKDGRIINQ